MRDRIKAAFAAGQNFGRYTLRNASFVDIDCARLNGWPVDSSIPMYILCIGEERSYPMSFESAVDAAVEEIAVRNSSAEN